MRRSWFVPALCAIVAAAAPVLAVSEPTQEELQVNRRLLERWRADPEHYARLMRDYKAFQALPAEKRDRLRELDSDLHDEDADTQARLRRVLSRYVEWLDGLSDKDRARIDAAEDANQRLRIVKDLREQEWIAHLPRADQDLIRATAADLRPRLVDDLRQVERKRRKDWQLAFVNLEEPAAIRPTKPERVQDFPPETQLYYHYTLMPALEFSEKERIRKADGLWPDLALAILELSRNHGSAKVPPGKWEGPKNLEYLKGDELPKELRGLFEFRKPKDGGLSKSDAALVKRVREARGKWPDFALAIHDMAESKGVTLSKPLGPCTLKDFLPAVQKYYEQRLSKVASQAELKKLESMQGKWPEYPFVFMDLAKKHDPRVPGTFLGGPPELWKAARGE